MKYKIANIIIDFTYCYDTFFKESFNDYKVDNNSISDFKLSSFVVDEIKDNKEVEFCKNKHKKIYHENNFEIIDFTIFKCKRY